MEQQTAKYKANKVLIEDKSSGMSLIQEMTGIVFGLEGYKPPPGGDKLMRLNAQSIRFESGSVFLPYEAPWLEDYIREITGFPGTRYDDRVDSTSQALEYLAHNSLSVWYKLGRAGLAGR